ncbi:hemerythrin domain-containing protein [Cyclobacterium sp.]|uniref:hemerythrin domain-containing protein n=1 Tax=Cyclobacterium sp. TaxID=1966343 RepID=UPI00199F1AD7|nr:hemerythrin domain-containing protein [Cyclobacterium sp.]MBD3629267.1 hemerythrin domain-containing protein [Cyclobacterium sp.]
MDLFEEIKNDHEKQRTLCDLLIKTNGASDGRKELYERLKRELQTHADAEERYFYRPLFKYDNTQDQARHSVAEHQEMDELMEELDNTDMSSPGWLATAKKLKEKIIHHLDEEEEDVFSLADQSLDDAKMNALARDYRSMMDSER